MRYAFCEECKIEEDSPLCVLYRKNCELLSLAFEFTEIGLKLFDYKGEDLELMEKYIREVSRKIYYCDPMDINTIIENVSNINVEVIVGDDKVTSREKAGLRRVFDLLKIELTGID